MDRASATSDHAVTAATAGASARPRRRWSDGPNYAWSPATDDAWSVSAHWPALVAVLCEQVAHGTGDLGRAIERLRAEGKLGRGDAAALRREIHAMRASGLALQQIVRLGAGLFNLSPDRVELGELARAVLRDARRELARRHAELSVDLQRAEVWVDGAIAAGLMRSGVDWALSFSQKVRLKVEAGGRGESARVVIRGALPSAANRAPGTPLVHPNRRMNDNLHWVLMRQLANCARLSISRSSSAATESAVIEFPATITAGVQRIT